MNSTKWRILLLDTKYGNVNHYLSVSIERALKQHESVESVARVQWHSAISTAKINRCNLFIAVDGQELNQYVCVALSKICKLSVLWLAEDPYELKKNTSNAHIFDLVYTNEITALSYYKHNNVKHLPFAADKQFQYHKVKPFEKCRYDIAFIGTAWPNRANFISELVHNKPTLKFKLIIPTNEHIPEINLEIPKVEYNGKVANTDFARIANTSRIMINLGRDFGNYESTKSTTPAPRIFETAMSGTCQLISSDIVEIDKFFDIGSELLVFDDLESAKTNIDTILNDPELRDDIAKKGQARTIRDHTYSERVRLLLRDVELIDPKNRKLVTSVKRKRILIVSHNIKGNRNWGGVESYVDWIRKYLRSSFDIWVYYDASENDLNRTILIDEDNNIVKEFQFNEPVPLESTRCDNRETAFSEILQLYNFSAIHFNHLIGHGYTLPLISSALGLPSMFSFHDYYSTCEHFTLIGYRNTFCGVENLNLNDCDLCLSLTMNAQAGSAAKRRALMKDVLQSFDILHANTVDVQKRILKVYPNLAKANWSLIGVPIARNEEIKLKKIPKKDGKINVAIPGNFTRFKGGLELISVFEQMSDFSVTFHILGRIDSDLKSILDQKKIKNVYMFGGYEPNEIQSILKGFDLSLHFSLWPETWCLALSEAWSAGVVPIVSDLGAFNDRVKDYQNGFIISHERPGQIIELLQEVLENPDILEKMKGVVEDEDIIYSEQHSEWLIDQYHSLTARNIGVDTPVALFHFNSKSSGLSTDSGKWLVTRSNIEVNTNAASQHKNSAQPNRTEKMKSLLSASKLHYKHHGTRSLIKRLLEYFFMGR